MSRYFAHYIPEAAGGPILKSVEGVLSFTGSSIKQTNKIIAGSLSFAGTLTKQINKIFIGVLSFSGVLSATKIIFQSIAGALSFAGALVTVFIPAPIAGAVMDYTNEWIRRCRTLFVGR